MSTPVETTPTEPRDALRDGSPATAKIDAHGTSAAGAAEHPIEPAAAPLNGAALHIAADAVAPLPDKAPPATPAPWQLGLLVGIPLALVAALYAPLFVALAKVWDNNPNYSHGYFVPVICLALAVYAWRRSGPPIAARVDTGAAVTGVLMLAIAAAMHVLATFMQSLLLDVASLVFVLRGLLLVLGGERAVAAYGFAALFLLFMAPLPVAWYQPLALAMQHGVSVVSSAVLDMTGVAVFREGYMLHLPGYTLEVGEACSGLRQLTAVLALAALIAHLNGRGLGFGLVLCGLSLPLAMAANCLRVIVSGYVLMLFGRQWAEGVFHTLEGLAIVAISAVLVMAMAWWLERIWPARGTGSFCEAKGACPPLGPQGDGAC